MPRRRRCKARALSVLKQKSPSVEDIFIDMDGITVARADLTVEATKVEAVIMERPISSGIARTRCKPLPLPHRAQGKCADDLLHPA